MIMTLGETYHGYPPDKLEKATQIVLEQAALLSRRTGRLVKFAVSNSVREEPSLCGAISFQNTGTPYMEDHPHTE
jgi:hypothetical protein